MFRTRHPGLMAVLLLAATVLGGRVVAQGPVKPGERGIYGLPSRLRDLRDLSRVMYSHDLAPV